MNRRRWLGLIASFLILGICGYLLPHDLLNAREHNAFEQRLREASQIDRDLSEIVLRIRLGLLSNYDSLVAQNAALRSTHGALAKTPRFILKDGREALAALLREAESTRRRKAELIEDFKSQYAILRNSLAYFPKLIGEVAERMESKPDEREIPPLLNRLLQDALVYNLLANGEDEARLQGDIQALAARFNADKPPDRELATDLRLVLAHASVILSRKPAVDAALEELAALPSSAGYDAMQARYEVEYAAALNRAQQERVLVYLGSLAALILVFALIIHELRKSASALRTAEVKYRSIFEKAGQGIFQTTPEGAYLSANPALARFYGYEKGEDLIQRIRNIGKQLYVSPKRREEFCELMEARREAVNFESEIRRKDGSVAWISENAHAVCDADGNVLYYEGIVDDITQRKRAEYERERLSQRELFHQRCLLSLAQLNKTDFDHAVREILDTTSYALGVERVSAWRLQGSGTPEESIALIDLFDFDNKQHTSPPLAHHAADFPRFFESLRQERYLVAADARTDPRTSELSDSYLVRFGIRSMVGVSVWERGAFAGLICLERTRENAAWEDDEIDFAVALGPLLAVCFETAERVRAEREAARERERAEQLLLNILPTTIARRLQSGEGLIADHFAEATVLFADIVDFTGMSAGIPPQTVVTMLNRIFSAFDQLAERHALEKIKTIGDAYMVVGGLPEPRADHTRAVVDMAIEMLEVCASLNEGAERPIVMRIGIHTGPVVAGVIGIRKFIYDLWGDTVNLASRMESHGLVGHIQVTAEVYEKVREYFAFTERGEIEIKGRGRQPVFLLSGRRQAPSSPDNVIP